MINDPTRAKTTTTKWILEPRLHYVLAVKNIKNSQKKYITKSEKLFCIVRESNPGRPRGRRAFYH
jgi:hypothetical protein